MYTSSITSTSGIGYTLQQETQRKSDDTASVADRKQSNETARRSYAGNSMSSVARNVELALEGIQPDSNGRITFQQVQEYKKELESEFSEKVKADLKAIGVDEDIEFRLVSDNSGGVRVLSEHPDAQMIQRYFAANPNMVEAFNRIETLGNFDKARAYQNKPISDLKKSIQIAGASAFMQSAGDNGMSLASQLMDFSGDNYFSGMVGLNVTI